MSPVADGGVGSSGELLLVRGCCWCGGVLSLAFDMSDGRGALTAHWSESGGKGALAAHSSLCADVVGVVLMLMVEVLLLLGLVMR